MDRERLSLLTRRKLGALTAGALSAAALERIESVERRLAGAEPADVAAGRRGRRKRRKFLVLGEASGDIYDLMVKRHKVTHHSGTESVADFGGVVVDHSHHDAESLADLDAMLDAYRTGVPVLFLNTRADLMESVHLEQFVAIRVEDMPAYALLRVGNDDAPDEYASGYGIAWPMVAGSDGEQTLEATWVAEASGSGLFTDAFDQWLRRTDEIRTAGSANADKNPARESKSGGSRSQSEVQPLKVRISALPATAGVYGAQGWGSSPTCSGRYRPPHDKACFNLADYCYYTPSLQDIQDTGQRAMNDVEYWMTSLVALQGTESPINRYNVYTASEIIAQVDPNQGKYVRTSSWRMVWQDRRSANCPPDDRTIRDDRQSTSSLLGYHMRARFGVVAVGAPGPSGSAPDFKLRNSLPQNPNNEATISRGTSRTQGWEVGASVGIEGDGPVSSISGSYRDEWGWSNEQSITVKDWSLLTNAGASEFWVVNSEGNSVIPGHYNNLDDLRSTGCGWPSGFCGQPRITSDPSRLNAIQRGQLDFAGEAYHYSEQAPTGHGVLEVTGTADYMGGAASWVASLKDFIYRDSAKDHIGRYLWFQNGVPAQVRIPVRFDLSAPALNLAVTSKTFTTDMSQRTPDLRDWIVRLRIIPNGGVATAGYRTKIFLSSTDPIRRPLPTSQVSIKAVKLVQGTTETDLPGGVDLFKALKPIEIPAGSELAVDIKCLYAGDAGSYTLKAMVTSRNPAEGSRFNRVMAESPVIV